MQILNVKFDKFLDHSIDAYIGMTGVYVIWAGKSLARPTYIGEGNILKRMSEHASRFPKPFDGFVAFTGEDSRKSAKRDAEIVEALLLDIANDTDRLPTQNKAPGKGTGIDRIFNSHGVFRLRVRGYDPLMPPRSSRPLTKAKVVTLRDDDEGIFLDSHSWRLRRRMY